MADTSDLQAWAQVGGWTLFSGFAHGYAYPSVMMTIAIPAINEPEQARLAKRFLKLFDAVEDLAAIDFPASTGQAQADQPGTRQDGRIATLRWFCDLCDHLNGMADMPVAQKSKCVILGAKSARICVPTLARAAAPMQRLIQIALRVFAGRLGAEEKKSLKTEAGQLILQMKAAKPTTSNSPRMVRAAVQNQICYQEIPGTSVIQYGLGRRSALFDSTFTQFTANIGARLARQKFEGAAVLRRNMLPVADHAVVLDEDYAVKVAEQIGYPVVTKPADKDGGIAVQADLRNEAEVRAAFQLAKKTSQRVLVERFVPGQDYRLTVFRGQLIWAIERQAGGVTGDGKTTVSKLVAAVNADPRRGKGQHAGLKRLDLDDEAKDLLKRDGLTTRSVPEDGQFIRLRRASNIGRGGFPMPVLDRVHPDNALLAIRAAQALRLDLAGVDLLVPDIAISWKDSGGSICEVNGQPEFGITGIHLYAQILKAMVGGDGHIPTVAIIGGETAEKLAKNLEHDLRAAGVRAGVHTSTSISVAGHVIDQSGCGLMPAGHMLSLNQSVDALIFSATDSRVLFTGFPVPRIDFLVLTGEAVKSGKAKTGLGEKLLPLEMLRLLAPHARQVLHLQGAPDFDANLAAALKLLNIRHGVTNRHALARAIHQIHLKTLPNVQGKAAENRSEMAKSANANGPGGKPAAAGSDASAKAEASG